MNTINEKYTRTFTTKERLLKSESYLQYRHMRHYIVRTESGRWTAMFIGMDSIPAGWGHFLVVS